MIPTSDFIENDVRDLLWPDLLDKFGVFFNYHLAEGDVVRGLRGALVEGMEGEPVSPGRYARFWLDARELPRAPRSADWIELGWTTYDVESVESTLADIPRLVIKLSGQRWLTQ